MDDLAGNLSAIILPTIHCPVSFEHCRETASFYQILPYTCPLLYLGVMVLIFCNDNKWICAVSSFQKKNDAWTIVFLSFVLLQSHWDVDAGDGDEKRVHALFSASRSAAPTVVWSFFPSVATV